MAWNYLRVHDRATAMRLIRYVHSVRPQLHVSGGRLTHGAALRPGHASPISDGLKRFIVRNRHLVRHPYNETVTQFFVHLIAKVAARTAALTGPPPADTLARRPTCSAFGRASRRRRTRPSSTTGWRATPSCGTRRSCTTTTARTACTASRHRRRTGGGYRRSRPVRTVLVC